MRLKIIKYILYQITFGTISLILVSCANQEETSTRSSAANDSIYIKLTMTTPTSTRSNPSGGEYGDGAEAGINHENDIHNLALFFYQNSDASNIESTNGIAPITQINVDPSKINQSAGSAVAAVAIPVNALKLNVSYHIVVVANINNTDLNHITSLSDLQASVIRNAYTTSTLLSDYNNFVMTSRFRTPADDAQYILTTANKIETPLKITVTLERLAARIDIVPQTSSNGATYNISGGFYSYPAGSEGDEFHLIDIKAVNCMHAGSYLLKHLTSSNTDGTIASGYRLIGTEQPESGDETNYVLDPWTREKTADATTMNLYETSTDINTFYNHYFNLSSTMNIWGTADLVKQCNNDTPYILTYTLENTMAQADQTSKYSTGLLLKGIYIPHFWYVLDGETLKAERATADSTFYLYDHVIYGSAPALLKAVNTKLNTNYTESQVLSLSDVYTYTGGVCYYNYWIRHSNNNNLANGIMEFAIVRNNIYRITINSFNSIGYSIPSNGNENDEYMNATLHVIPWSL